MVSADSAYPAAVLAIYLVLFFPAAYTAWKHGTRGLAWIGWGYFVVFCLLRVTGSAMQVADPGSTGAAIISSVGLSPLTIAAAGVLHEGRFYLFSLHRNPEANKIELIFVLVFHIVVAAAIALLATGASGLASLGQDEAGPSKLNKDWNLAGGGALLLLFVLFVLFGTALFTYVTKPSKNRHNNRHHGDHSASQQRKQRRRGRQLSRRLVLAVVIASPMLMIRVVGAVAYFFGQRREMNPSTGTLGFRVGLYLAPELLAAVVLLAGGLAARDVSTGVEEDGDGVVAMG